MGEEGNIEDGQAQHGGIVCVLQTQYSSLSLFWDFLWLGYSLFSVSTLLLGNVYVKTMK